MKCFCVVALTHSFQRQWFDADLFDIYPFPASSLSCSLFLTPFLSFSRSLSHAISPLSIFHSLLSLSLTLSVPFSLSLSISVSFFDYVCVHIFIHEYERKSNYVNRVQLLKCYVYIALSLFLIHPLYLYVYISVCCLCITFQCQNIQPPI